MDTIGELIRNRNREVHTVQASETVIAAALSMTRLNVGALPVLDGHCLVGVFSERDMLNRVVAARLDPQTATVRDVMTPEPFVVSPADGLERCLWAMKQHNFRHLPVCDGERLIGFISLRDLLLHDLDEKEVDLRRIHEYLNAS
jgi:CBS domain-containing protein